MAHIVGNIAMQAGKQEKPRSALLRHFVLWQELPACARSMLDGGGSYSLLWREDQTSASAWETNISTKNHLSAEGSVNVNFWLKPAHLPQGLERILVH
jgi:hypothetical protein